MYASFHSALKGGTVLKYINVHTFIIALGPRHVLITSAIVCIAKTRRAFIIFIQQYPQKNK